MIKGLSYIERNHRMSNQHYEQLLNIQTSGFQRDFPKSMHYHRYEPKSITVACGGNSYSSNS